MYNRNKIGKKSWSEGQVFIYYSKVHFFVLCCSLATFFVVSRATIQILIFRSFIFFFAYLPDFFRHFFSLYRSSWSDSNFDQYVDFLVNTLTIRQKSCLKFVLVVRFGLLNTVSVVLIFLVWNLEQSSCFQNLNHMYILL